MKGSLTKVTIGVVCLCSFLSANENISKSLSNTSITTNHKYNISKDALSSLENQSIINAGNSLNIDTSMFNKNRKLSLYLKVSRSSKFGFKYKF